MRFFFTRGLHAAFSSAAHRKFLVSRLFFAAAVHWQTANPILLRHFQKTCRSQSTSCKASLQDRSLEMILEVNPNPNRRMSRALWDQLHATLALQLIADIVGECLSVVNGGHAIPLTQRMHLL